MPEVTNQDSSRRRFELERCIGKGGFGVVYQARMSTASGFSRTVAVKILSPDVEGVEQVAERLRDEARMLGLISHPSIVQAQDLITLAGRPAVVMEYVPGVNLSWLINPKRFGERIPTTISVAVVRDVAGALDAAYNRPSTVTGAPLEVLHRDVKPGNIRITPDGIVKILDFGIARSTRMDREAETRAHQLGSLGYMAPELLVGGGASTASDVYALGVVFCECLRRKRFGWPSETQEAHDRRVAERLEGLDLDATGEGLAGLNALVSEMLAFEPDRRPTAADVRKRCRRLERLLDGPLPEEWAPEKLPSVHKPSDPEDVELTGRTLFEDSSVFALPQGRDLDDVEFVADPGLVGSGAERAGGVDAGGARGPSAPPSHADPDLTIIEPMEPVAAATAPTASSRRGLWTWVVVAVAVVIAAAAAVAGVRHWGRERVGLTGAEEVEDPADVAVPVQPPAVVEPPAPEPQVADQEPMEADEPPPEATSLEPDAAEETVSEDPVVPAPAPVVSTSRRKAPEPEVAAPTAAPLQVRLSSVPFGIEVYVDGKSLGKTPITTELTPGAHAVMYLDGADTLRTEVVVQDGGSNFFNYVKSEGKVR